MDGKKETAVSDCADERPMSEPCKSFRARKSRARLWCVAFLAGRQYHGKENLCSSSDRDSSVGSKRKGVKHVCDVVVLA